MSLIKTNSFNSAELVIYKVDNDCESYFSESNIFDDELNLRWEC